MERIKNFYNNHRITVTFLAIVMILLILMVTSSCTPEGRLRRLVSNHPELVTQDTLLVNDTVYIPAVKYDTLTRIVYHDTVRIIDNSRITIKYFATDSTIYIQGKCKDTTIIRTLVIPYPAIKVNKNSWWDNVRSLWPLYLIILGAVLYFKFSKWGKRLF